jgi:hypothetical protein
MTWGRFAIIASICLFVSIPHKADAQVIHGCVNDATGDLRVWERPAQEGGCH